MLACCFLLATGASLVIMTTTTTRTAAARFVALIVGLLAASSMAADNDVSEGSKPGDDKKAPNSNSKPGMTHPVIEWLRTREGGFFSEKVQFVNGTMYALDDFEKGEAVMTIPPTALLPPSENYEVEGYWRKECGTADRLVREYRELGESKSDYWPYVQYVFESFPHRTVPLGWSDAGKEIVDDIVDDDFDPQNFGRGSYREACGYDDDEIETFTDEQFELYEAAWRIVVSRGWNHVMVPGYDMVNHRNGRWFNVERDDDAKYDMEVDGDFYIVALKPIKKGTELHNSYSQCHDVTCRGIALRYLTAQVFAEYGFVEQYPRRFAFFTGHEGGDEDVEGMDDDLLEQQKEYGLVIEVDDTEQEEGKLGVEWLTGKPNKKQVEWMEDQLKRLRELDVEERVAALEQDQQKQEEKKKDKDGVSVGNFSQHERTAVLQYYNALKEALELAIQSGKSQVPPPSLENNKSKNDVEEDDDDDDDDDEVDDDDDEVDDDDDDTRTSLKKEL